MSILHADGFAHYGTGATSQANMAQGVFAAVSGNSQCTTAHHRGDGTHSLLMENNGLNRRVLGVNRTSIGFGAAFFVNGLPIENDEVLVAAFLDGAAGYQFSVTYSTTGKLRVKNGQPDGTLLAETASPVVTAGAFHHIEFLAVVGNAGAIEIRVNGESVLSASPIDTQGTANSGVEQYVLGNFTTSGVELYIADLVVWDTLNSINDTFLGDVQCLRINMTSDEAATAWTRNTGSTDFGAIADTTPDADTTYVEATATSQISEYGMTNLPANASDVMGFVTYDMARKTDAGAGSMQVSLLSAGDTAAGTARPMTEIYTYWQDVFNVNPDTGARFTPTEFNAATLRIERTA